MPPLLLLLLLVTSELVGAEGIGCGLAGIDGLLFLGAKLFAFSYY